MVKMISLFIFGLLAAVASAHVDNSQSGSDYHYSFKHNGQKMSHSQGSHYCRGLGGGWDMITIDSPQEMGMVSSALQQHRSKYIWTAGQRRGNGWVGGDGRQLSYFQWSPTGGAGRRQPDNRDGNESCLSVLNNFYSDGVQMHDVGCSHRKPVICERRGGGHGGHPQQQRVSHPQQQRFSHPQQQRFSHPQQQRFSHPQQQRFHHPQQQRFVRPQQHRFVRPQPQRIFRRPVRFQQRGRGSKGFKG